MNEFHVINPCFSLFLLIRFCHFATLLLMTLPFTVCFLVCLCVCVCAMYEHAPRKRKIQLKLHRISSTLLKAPDKMSEFQQQAQKTSERANRFV